MSSLESVCLDSVVSYGPSGRVGDHNMRALTIGKVARDAEVGVATVRFYERGLLKQPARRMSGNGPGPSFSRVPSTKMANT